MEFDWRDEKSAQTLTERGFGFDFAALIFLGRTLAKIDDRKPYGERRVYVIGDRR